ncbi:MAG TPA: hypothetical protein VFW11_14360, partial [Cyclobacteriaceae bacterium]|nr:hypothetical protein [Cyclobacteriaceae bacterium]
MNRRPLIPGIIAGLIAMGISSFDFSFWSAAGVGFLVFIFFAYLVKLGKTVPILELMLLISSLQWVFGAHQSYLFHYQHYKYHMYVGRDEYMSIVVPGLLAFALGISLLYPKYNFDRVNMALERFTFKYRNVPVYLIVIGVVFPLFRAFAPPTLSFILFLFGNFKFIGAVLLLFQPHSARKWWATTLLITLTLLGSIQSGMFHDLLLWLALMFSFIVYRMQFSLFFRFALVLVGFLFVFLIQSVKGEFREMAKESIITGKTRNEIFFELVSNRTGRLDELLSDEKYLSEMNVRLNQGWIISAIIRNVPAREPYAEGETIIEAFRASLIPRFLEPEKKMAGGQENFRRFTGLELGEKTSMGTSV